MTNSSAGAPTDASTGSVGCLRCHSSISPRSVLEGHIGSPWQMISTCSWIGEEQRSETKKKGWNRSEYLPSTAELLAPSHCARTQSISAKKNRKILRRSSIWMPSVHGYRELFSRRFPTEVDTQKECEIGDKKG